MAAEPAKMPQMAAAIMSVDWGWLRGERKRNRPELDTGRAIAAANLVLPFLSLSRRAHEPEQRSELPGTGASRGTAWSEQCFKIRRRVITQISKFVAFSKIQENFMKSGKIQPKRSGAVEKILKPEIRSVSLNYRSVLAY
jgi:hypothetical protein